MLDRSYRLPVSNRIYQAVVSASKLDETLNRLVNSGFKFVGGDPSISSAVAYGILRLSYHANRISLETEVHIEINAQWNKKKNTVFLIFKVKIPHNLPRHIVENIENAVPNLKKRHYMVEISFLDFVEWVIATDGDLKLIENITGADITPFLNEMKEINWERKRRGFKPKTKINAALNILKNNL